MPESVAALAAVPSFTVEVTSVDESSPGGTFEAIGAEVGATLYVADVVDSAIVLPGNAAIKGLGTDEEVDGTVYDLGAYGSVYAAGGALGC